MSILALRVNMIYDIGPDASLIFFSFLEIYQIFVNLGRQVSQISYTLLNE